jgi:hypothetical protein
MEIKKSKSKRMVQVLKPVKTGLTDKGLVDILNKKYWNGTTPGMRDKKKFAEHLAEVKDASKYADYFQELYVGCDTQNLAKRVEDVYTNSELFNKEVGMFALAEYKRVDNWI